MIQKRIAVLLAVAGMVSFAQFAAAQGPACGSVCPDACPEKVCKSITVTKTVTKKEFSDVCEQYCRPTCSFFGLFGGCDCGCKVATKKTLVIHYVKHDECEKKCVLEDAAPACGVPVQPYSYPVQSYPPAMGPVPNPGQPLPK